MNCSFSVEAYNSFYNQGMEAYNKGDISQAKISLLKAAETAESLSKDPQMSSMRLVYFNRARDIIKFVQDISSPRTKVESAENTNFEFTPVDEHNKITFNDVAGLSEVKTEIKMKVLEPIKDPKIAETYKIKAGGKILLYGPPGTGKTLIARAIAGEVDAKFYSVNCQDLISKYMGESSAKLDKLFSTAQQNERAVIFFDEIDSIACKREGASGVDGEMARFVATFLTKVDGFEKSKTNKMLLLLAATNRPWALDSAMLRGGRFDTQIYVCPPDYEAIMFMLNKEMRDLPIEDNVNLGEVAKVLNGFGGGDIVSICSKVKQLAYERAVKSGNIEKIRYDDFIKVISKQKNVITKEELLNFENYKNQ